MPGPTQEVRTIMYSVEANGNVVVHKLPFNGNEKYGDPRIPGSPKTPSVMWRNMNAQERKAYQEAKKRGG